MNALRSVATLTLLSVVTHGCAFAQQKANLGENAALRYWAAFAQVQDSAISEDEAKKMNSILDGSAQYDDAEYRGLVEKNASALDTMARGAKLSNCDWGLDYQMGAETPVEYVRKALILGRLNVLYALHLLAVGDKDKAVSSLSAGLHFSHDVANGGSLFATLVAKTLLVAHLKVIESGFPTGELSGAHRVELRKAIMQLGTEGLDWKSAMTREFEIPLGLNPQASLALAKIAPAYVGALDNPAALPKVQQMIVSAPRQSAEAIPNPARVLQARQELIDELRGTRSKLR